jgi:hypothetical protein
MYIKCILIGRFTMCIAGARLAKQVLTIDLSNAARVQPPGENATGCNERELIARTQTIQKRGASTNIYKTDERTTMAERVSGPYRGYYISAAARLTQPPDQAGGKPNPPIYVGTVSVAQGGPDNVHRFEALVDLGEQRRFATEDEALGHVEQAARAYIDRLLQNS